MRSKHSKWGCVIFIYKNLVGKFWVIFPLINCLKLKSILSLIENLYFLLVTFRLLVNEKCESSRRVI